MDERFRTIIPQLALFGGLDEVEQEKVASLVRWETFAAGAAVGRQGEVAETMYILVEGRCRVLMDIDDSGHPFTLAELGPGQCFGEMALVEIQPRSASVVALTDVVVAGLTNSDFMTLYDWRITTYSLVLLNIAREISRRLRRANEVIAACARAVRENWKS